MRASRRPRLGLVGAVALTAASLAATALAAPAAPASAPATGDHSATREAMDAAVKSGVPGVVGQAKDTYGTWKGTSGVGDLRTGRPRSADEHYRIGSITKTFVATVLLQLEAEGELSLDDKVDTWLPGVVRGNLHDGRHITLRQLLNHTSGVFNYRDDKEFVRTYMLKDAFFRTRYDTVTLDQHVKYAMANKRDFAPGTSWKYSNTNYSLAAMVIEKATGNAYGDEIRRRVVEPLRLHATSVPGSDPRVPRPSSRAYAKLAESADGPSHDVTELNATRAGGGGDMISDAADLNRFFSALLRGKLLPKEQLAEMTTTVEAKGLPGVRYGLGIAERELSCGVEVWGHHGGITGWTSEAVTTADGRHSLAFNFNGDWSGDSDAVIEAEFCG
ncbi:serine hydrolase domain-containing protein [Streptomyces alboniger]|uniref:Class A beta-lactamase-related serine hydrolase n=1 Tax=Streptomyces alboniger TaxID=132473 RepID=A0A5J6HS27_STRAD|nr:serine hydrolase domain-containing protein [Streptomyces alboniger]QEV21080.1 class A beta-lactamase-related serine hydrolase [Streptomyces alboniger]